jgi:hypothetical protein
LSNTTSIAGRVVYVWRAFANGRAAILLIGGDKSGEWNTWYDRMVPVADDLFDEHLRELESGVSQLENQSDLYLSTLKRYIEAVGGELEVAAVFDGERIEIGVPA